MYIAGPASYIILAQISKQWTFENADVQPFQPAMAGAVAFAVASPRRHRYTVALVSVVIGATVCWLFALDATGRSLLADVTGRAITTCVALGVGLTLLRRQPIRAPGISIGWFWLTMVAALAGSLSCGAILKGPLTWSYLWHNTIAWGLGLYAVTPFVLIPTALRVRLSRPAFLIELGSTSVALAVVTVYAFSTTGVGVFLILPFLFWLCVRGGYRIGLPASVAVGICACVATSQGLGPFAGVDELAFVQAFLAVIFLSAGILVNFEEVAEVQLARNKALFDAMPDLVVVSDQRNKLVAQNTPPESLEGVDLASVLDRAGWVAPRPSVVEFRSETVEGRTIEMRRLAIGDGTTLSVIRDISDLVAQANQLALSDDRWRRVSDAAQEGIVELDSDSIVRYANERFAEITELDPDTIVGSHASTFLDSRRWEQTASWRLGAVAGDPAVWEVGMQSRDGRPRWGLVSLSRQVDENGSFNGAIVLLTDITDVKAAEIARIDLADELSSAERGTRARLARDLHDGPLQDLTAVHLILGHLANEHSDDEIIAKASAAMTDALADLRSGVRALDPVDVADGGIAEALRRHANLAIGVSEIKLQIEAGADPPRGSSARVLYRVGREAITNAAKHAAPTQILIRVAQTEAAAMLCVEDDGCGFTPRGPSVTGQMGMRSMIERARQAGGEATIESSPGEGTRVSVVLPS